MSGAVAPCVYLNKILNQSRVQVTLPHRRMQAVVKVKYMTHTLCADLMVHVAGSLGGEARRIHVCVLLLFLPSASSRLSTIALLGSTDGGSIGHLGCSKTWRQLSRCVGARAAGWFVSHARTLGVLQR